MLQAHRHSKNLEASLECDLSIDLNSLLTGRIIAFSHGWRLDVSGPYLSYSATRTWPQSKRSLGCVWLELSTGGLIVSRSIRKSFSRCCILLDFLFWLRSVCVCVCVCPLFFLLWLCCCFCSCSCSCSHSGFGSGGAGGGECERGRNHNTPEDLHALGPGVSHWFSTWMIKTHQNPSVQAFRLFYGGGCWITSSKSGWNPLSHYLGWPLTNQLSGMSTLLTWRICCHLSGGPDFDWKLETLLHCHLGVLLRASGA